MIGSDCVGRSAASRCGAPLPSKRIATERCHFVLAGSGDALTMTGTRVVTRATGFHPSCAARAWPGRNADAAREGKDAILPVAGQEVSSGGSGQAVKAWIESRCRARRWPSLRRRTASHRIAVPRVSRSHWLYRRAPPWETGSDPLRAVARVELMASGLCEAATTWIRCLTSCALARQSVALLTVQNQCTEGARDVSPRHRDPSARVRRAETWA